MKRRVTRYPPPAFSLITIMAGLILGRWFSGDTAAAQSPVGPLQGRVPVPALQPLVIEDVTVIDVRDGRRLSHQSVIISGDRIQALGSGAVLRRPAGARVVNGQGKYLIPGLWDMHYHDWGLPDVEYAVLIANGITGIREPGSGSHLSSVDTLRRWRQEIAAGRRIGPRQPIILGQMYPDGSFDKLTPEDGRYVIDSTKAAGAEFFKLHAFNSLSRATYFAMLAESRRVGLSLVGHLPFTVTAVEASDSGQRTLEHVAWEVINGVRSRLCPVDSLGVGGCREVHFPHGHALGLCDGDSATVETCGLLAQRFRRNGTWWVPTLAVHYYPDRGQWRAQPRRPIISRMPYISDSLRRVVPMEPGYIAGHRIDLDSALTAVIGLMARADMPLLAGTDAFGATIHEELMLLVEKGVSPLAALQAATLNPARYLGLTDSLGTIGPGQLADLVLLDADPLTDIRHTAQIRAVVANGRYFDRATLDRMLDEVGRRIKAEHLRSQWDMDND